MQADDAALLISQRNVQCHKDLHAQVIYNKY